MPDRPLEYDVVVLGAGPGGLIAADTCARAGLRTVVVEKKKEIGSRIRTSGATYIRAMREFGVPESLYHRVDEVRFLSPGNEARFGNLDDGIAVLDVRGLLQHLAVRAADGGAELRPGTRALDALREGGSVSGIICRPPDGRKVELRAPVTIDATGIAGVLARRVLGHDGFTRCGSGLEYDLHAPGWPPGEFVLIVGGADAPTGYGWIFPWGDRRVRAGVGVTIPDGRDADLSVLLDRLLHDPRFDGRLDSAAPLEVHKGLIPAEPFPVAPCADGLLAIGDAAGQASALAGEGIRYAMKMGRLAGEATVAALASGDPSAAMLGRAHEEWETQEGRNMRVAMEFNRRMVGFSDTRWDEAIGLLGRMSDKQFLQFLRTDFTAGFFAGLIARNPGLAGRSLIRLALKMLK